MREKATSGGGGEGRKRRGGGGQNLTTRAPTKKEFPAPSPRYVSPPPPCPWTSRHFSVEFPAFPSGDHLRNSIRRVSKKWYPTSHPCEVLLFGTFAPPSSAQAWERQCKQNSLIERSCNSGLRFWTAHFSRAAKRGGGGGYPIWTFLAGRVLPFLSICPFLDLSIVFFRGFLFFPGFSRFVRGLSRLVLFLFLGLLQAPTRNGPERVRNTIRTFPEKKWETPRFGTPPA